MPSEIDVWLAFEHEIDKSFLHDMYVQYLSVDERHRMTRFGRRTDRDRYVVARALVRAMLSRYLSADPRSLSFYRDAFDRPHVANCRGTAGFVFNLSHSGGVAALGVTKGEHIGVDVEDVPSLEVVREVQGNLATEEREMIAASPEARQSRMFTELWTLKESYVKALGFGMSVPLDSFRFLFPDAESVVLDDPEANRRGSGLWSFWQFALPTGHIVAICSDGASHASRIRLYRVVPFVSVTGFSCPLIRCSRQ